MNNIIISAKNIQKTYKEGNERITVLNNVNIEIEKGSRVIITGPSGSGKSTLLHILGTLLSPDSGEVFIKDENIFKLPENRRAEIRKRHIGFVFQYHYLFSEFTALQNVMVPLILSGKKEKEARNKAILLLELLGIKDRKDHRPNELSGGEAQRVQLARALANEPDILFLDEPTGNLDHKRAMSLMEMLLKLNKEMGTTLCMVSHNRELVRFFNYHYAIKDGQLENEY